ncbi:MAG TPA: hypothetical protein VFE47_20270 [Tepidisphaeraceae bacterium]|jgi:hypothetical protein|nr:hypothetical protein [Tepidisphaeraceae bacterium]
MRPLSLILSVLVIGKIAAGAPAGSALDHHSGDLAKSHVEQVSDANHIYTVHQGGTMDGENCRSPLSVGMADGPAIVQTWESNRSVRLENIGQTDVINPWLSNGKNTFRTIDEIVASAVEPGMSDREKAFAIWFQEISHRYHDAGDNDELGDPVKLFNVYGHNTCGNDSICLAGLWKRAGMKVSPARLVGHCVTQAFFDGRWNLFDGDMDSMYLLRDNKTVASEQDLVRDHDLIKRSHTQGILNPDSRANDEWEASIYVYEGKPQGDRNSATGTTMNMVLRPGEAITWTWGHANPIKYHGSDKPRYPGMICNGLWEYRPDFSNDIWKKGTESTENIQATGGELTAAQGKSGIAVWNVRSPYVFVGGRLDVEGSGAKFSVSFDGKSWADTGNDLGNLFPPGGKAHYQYKLRCELPAGAHLKRLSIVNDIQMAPLALPGMSVGENQFTYTDQSPLGRQVRITHAWVERSEAKPPAAPQAVISPPDGGEADAATLVFRWQGAADPDGNKIVDYHFELSQRPDMKWPFSTNFYKLISNTADHGKAQYTLAHGGLLPTDQKFYWRVKAKNDKGVWGPWSATWSFTPRGPASPVEVTLDFNADHSVGTLKWASGGQGRKPVVYRVYGSDEKGFSISDGPFKAVVGTSKEVPAARSGNFIAEVSGNELAVIGPDVKLANANCAYYRVLAVDDKGMRSDASDFAESPRPIIYSRPPTQAKVGSEYRYAPAAIRSLGDVRTHVVDGRETMNYWDVEKPRFELQQGPAWLKIEPQTGVLTGIPDHAGKVEVVVTATIDRGTRTLDERQLVWGVEKILSTGTERVGTATQKFSIDVAQ